MNQTQEQIDAETALYKILCGAQEAAKLTHCAKATVYKRLRRFALRELARRGLSSPCPENIAPR